ncbi:MAG: hypothetical protein JRC57_09160 [Deltaproteobacteria bacterium]|nr:hypothetical protein [Deltaproteobacteria bacterium]
MPIVSILYIIKETYPPEGGKQIKEIKCVYQENSYFYHCACCVCPIVVLPELGRKDRPEGGRSRTAILT